MDQFDPNIPGLIGGAITRVAVNETPPFGLANRVVNRQEPFTIGVEWNVSGPLTTLWIAALGGSWLVRVYTESRGGGPEILLGTTSVPVGSFSGPQNDRTYQATINVPAFALPEDDFPAGDVSGQYKLAVSAFLNSTLGPAGYDMLGFMDGPLIQVENPV